MEKHWLQKFAENYMGGGDVDQFHVEDGTEMTDRALEDPKNNGGVYQDNEYYPATMPYSLDIHDSQNSQADKDKPNPSRSDEYSDFPYSEEAVDDNHANAVASLTSPEEGDEVAGAGANFLHNAPDSPKILNDGHPLEEQVDGVGYPATVNNVPPKARPTDGVLLEDPDIVERDPDKIDSTPDINKGRTLMSSRLNPFARSAREVQADAWVDRSGSNVADVEYPDEIDRKHRRSTEDFGTKDQMSDGNTAATEPFKGYSGDEYDSTLYSGIQPSAADKTLQIYLEKVAASLKKADFTQVMPSANPNSGPDDDEDTEGLISYIQQPAVMLDGKTNGTNIGDKAEYDNNLNRKKRKYLKTEDTEDYFSSENSGGGFGMEGDTQNFSGVNPGD